MAKTKVLDNETILTKVQAKVREAVSLHDSKLSKERERVIQHYNSKLPRRQHLGSSSYVATDVYDSVESMKAQIVETFSGNDDEIVSFPPLGNDDAEKARIATAYTSHVVFRENDGYQLFCDVVHDGLTARVGIAKPFWETITDYQDEEFSDVAYEDVAGLAAQEDISDLEANVDPMTGAFSGKLKRTIDRSKVTIVSVPPEEFLIEQRAKSIEMAGITAHRTLKTKAELKEMYPDHAKEIDGLGYDDAKGLDTTPEVLARFDAVEGGADITDNAIQPELEKVMFYEAFVRMDKGYGAHLYKVCYANQLLFACDEVDRAPFIAFVPLPVPHSFYGNNYGARVISTQNARTVLTRAVLDHSTMTTNPRWTVLKGGLLNPKEMLDNRLGGVVNINRPDAVRPLDQQPLNPFVFQVLEMLKSNKEESTGISALSQGLNKDAISSQNSEGLIDNLVSLSQQRQKIIARNFAYGFLIPLFLEVYRLVLENEKKEKIIEVAGNWVPVDPREWAERRVAKVKLHLGYGERDRKAAKYESAYMKLASDPAIGHMFTSDGRYAMITDAMKLAGFDAPEKYIADPKTVQPPGPDPLAMKELEIKDKTAEAALITAKANAESKNMQAQVDMFQTTLDAMMQKLDAALKQRESERLDIETANRVDVSQREIELAEKAPAEGTNTIVSANG